MGKIIAICISEKKGTQKHSIESAVLKENWGIEGHAHAGKWHRQVSLLSFEKFDEFQKKGAEIDYGAFGENILVEGFDLRTIPVGTRFQIGEAILELTQIGKDCHSHCEIYKKMGDCIMPREGLGKIGYVANSSYCVYNPDNVLITRSTSLFSSS